MSRPQFLRPCLIGVVHLLPTPGAPRFAGSFEAVLAHARADARTLVEGGVDAVIVENFGDTPFYPGPVPAETIASLALAVAAVRELAGARPVGVNVLRNDVRAALGIAAATGAAFVRVNVHTSAAVTDQGIVEGRAWETVRERGRIAPDVAILADAHVKHATPLSREPLAESVHDLVLRAMADGVIVSGPATGRPPSAERVREAREAAGSVPVLVGSGLDARNARELLAHATGAIVGTALKHEGRVEKPVDIARVRALRKLFDEVGR
ncbi:MAG: BtpA/SgcQ family protein [Planctomycetota bacterium]